MSADVDSLYRSGVDAWRGGDPAGALRLARQAIELDARLPALHYLCGRALLDAERPREAADAFSRATALAPPYPLVRECELHTALALARADLLAGIEPVTEPLGGGHAGFVSVVICSVSPAKFERVSAQYRSLLGQLPHEIVGIHDARSLAEGYNRGLRSARGELLIFCHDDIAIHTPDFAAKLLRHMASCDLLGVAGTTAAATASWLDADWRPLRGQIGMPLDRDRCMVTVYGVSGGSDAAIQAMDGVWLAARRDTALQLGFDESTFDGWHGYDFDFSFRVHLAGWRTRVATDLLIAHASRGGFRGDWETYAKRALAKHRDRLPPGAALPRQPQLCAVEVRSSREWQLLTQRLNVEAPRNP